MPALVAGIPLRDSSQQAPPTAVLLLLQKHLRLAGRVFLEDAVLFGGEPLLVALAGDEIEPATVGVPGDRIEDLHTGVDAAARELRDIMAAPGAWRSREVDGADRLVLLARETVQ